ncbi:MAG: extracellular solute-binding protein [Patescibacteria group bacterium]
MPDNTLPQPVSTASIPGQTGFGMTPQKPFQSPPIGASNTSSAAPVSTGFKVTTSPTPTTPSTRPVWAPSTLSSSPQPGVRPVPPSTGIPPAPRPSAAPFNSAQPFKSTTPSNSPSPLASTGTAVATGGIAGGIASGSIASKPLNAAPVGAPTFKPSTSFPAKSPTPLGTTGTMGMVGKSPASSTTPNSATLPSSPPPGSTGTQPHKSVLRFLPFVLLGAVVVALLAFAAYWFLGRNSTGSSSDLTPTQAPVSKKTIVYWGLWEPTTVVQQVLADFEKENPGYQVQYVQQSFQDYRERLQAEIAKGSGPDVFRFHASWVPMLKNELSPLPEKIMTPTEYSQTFYPIATQQLTSNGNIVGIPLMIDGLALYYNKDIFSIANRTPPKDWEEMKKTATDLTIKSGGKITRGGVAMGTASNVEHFSEIIALLMLQNGADPADPTSPKAVEAINFYTDFAKKLAVWDATLPNATVAFGKGDVAMMIAPSWRAHEIKAANPNLQFDIVPVPQLPDKPRITWASFWAEGVSVQSKEKEGSWLLLKYLSSAEVEKKLYSDASNVRAFGELYSRQDLADQIAANQYVGAYLQDAPFARAWYMNAYTHDNGINDRIIKYYEDLLNAPGAVTENVKTVKQGTDQVLGQYGLATPTAVPAAN